MSIQDDKTQKLSANSDVLNEDIDAGPDEDIQATKLYAVPVDLHQQNPDTTSYISSDDSPRILDYSYHVQSASYHKKGFPLWFWAFAFAVLCGFLGYIAFKSYEMELWGPVTLPDVTGLSEDQALETLEAAGFSVNVSYEVSDYQIDHVISMNPEGGQRIPISETIKITIASARVIPDLVGRSYEEAVDMLESLGAQHIETETVASDLAENTVLSSSPQEGESFISEDIIVLTIARPYRVPELVGLTLEEAQKLIEEEGLSCQVHYTASSEKKNTVIASDPGPGESLVSDTPVMLSVASPSPSGVYKLLDYFKAVPQYLAEYITSAGFDLTFGTLYDETSNAFVAYKNESGDVLFITDEPEEGSHGDSNLMDALAQGASVGGIRIAFSASSLPEGADSETVLGLSAIMDACGFEVMSDHCTQSDVVLPEEIISALSQTNTEETQETQDTQLSEEEVLDATQDTTPDLHFICGSGKQGEYTWVIFIGGEGSSSKVLAIAAPTSHFDSLDLSNFDNSVCDYVVYRTLFE